MRRVLLFATACILAGIGGALGSILGHAFGQTGLWVGGVLGGLAGSAAAAGVGVGRDWISRTQFRSTAIGAMVGFLAASAIAVKTLSSPIGPALSTLLVGIGALIGERISRRG
jgi:hypothetical protein